MLQHLAHVLILAVAVFATAKLVPGVRVKSFGSAIVFAFVLAIVDKLLYGLLVFLSLPFIAVTFGLFLLVINGILWWIADKFVSGVELDGFGSTMLAAALCSLLNGAFLFFVR